MKNKPSRTILTLGAELCVSLVAVGSIGASAGSVYADTTSNSSSANASITVSPTIRLTLSGGDLVINDLVPGSTADSNVITASVTTNSASGYFLSATTGTASTNTDLTHNTNNTYKFTNLDSNKASLSNFNDNTWGYSYSIDNGTNWISGDNGTATTGYNGLPLDNDDSGATGIKLLSTDTYSQTGSIKFKIGAKAASTQASGTYTGVVNFYAVTNPEPSIYMQDMTTARLNQLLPNEHDTTTLYDMRDDQPYTIAKLKDGKYWMTKNLRLDFSDLANPIDASNTHNPTASFIAAANDNPLSSDAWCTSIYTPECPNRLIYNSSNIGDHTLDGFGHTYDEYGVYYNWYTATAGHGTIETSDAVVAGDICPYGWHLPTQTEYSNLDRAMGGTGGAHSPTVSQWTSPPANFVRSGTYYGDSATGRGEYGEYYSSRAANTYYADKLYIMTDAVATMSGNYMNYKYIGTPVRCVHTE